MSIEELMCVFEVKTIKHIYNAYNFRPLIKINYKDDNYELIDCFEEKLWRTDNPSKETLLKEHLLRKLYNLYELRNSKIDEILNN